MEIRTAWEGGTIFRIENTCSKGSFGTDLILAGESEVRNDGALCLCFTCFSLCFKRRQRLLARAAAEFWYFWSRGLLEA